MIFISLAQLIISNNIPVYFEENNISEAFQASLIFDIKDEKKTSFFENDIFAILLSEAGSTENSFQISPKEILENKILNALKVSYSFSSKLFHLSFFAINDNIPATLNFLNQSFFRSNFIHKDTNSLINIQKELIQAKFHAKSNYVEILLDKLFSFYPSKKEDPLDFFNYYNEEQRMNTLKTIHNSSVIFFAQGSKENLEKFTSFFSKKQLHFKEKFFIPKEKNFKPKEKILFIFEDNTLDSSKIFLKNFSSQKEISLNFYERKLLLNYLFGLDSLFMQEFRENKKLVYSINGDLRFYPDRHLFSSELITSTSNPKKLLEHLLYFLKKDLFNKKNYDKKNQAFATQHSINMQNFYYKTQLILSKIISPKQNENISIENIKKSLSIFQKDLLNNSIFITGPKKQIENIQFEGYKKIIIKDPILFLKQ